MNTRPHTLHRNTKGFGAIELLLILVVIAVLAGTGWYIWQRERKNTSTSNTNSSSQHSNTSPATKPDPYAGWKTYTSKTGGFTVSYPKDWTIEGHTGQYNTTRVPASQMDGTEGSVLLLSSSAKSNSFGIWLSISNSSSPTSSLNSAFTQIPYAQGTILKSLSSGVAIWEANQSLTTNGHTNPDTCTPFETVSDGAFGLKLNNGKYLDASMSFCYAQGQTTTYTYSKQTTSTELQQGMSIMSSLRQN